MIQTSPNMRILVATQPVDFRRGIDGPTATCRKELQQYPMTGCAFVFRNRKGTAIKILLCDGQGYWLCQKRFSQGRLLHWPRGDAASRPLDWRRIRFKCCWPVVMPTASVALLFGGGSRWPAEEQTAEKSARSARHLRQDLLLFAGTAKLAAAAQVREARADGDEA